MLKGNRSLFEQRMLYLPLLYVFRGLLRSVEFFRIQGIHLVCDLIDVYGLDVVQAYMGHIRANAEGAVRDLLKAVAKKTREATGSSTLEAVDCVDDGTEIRLSVQLNEEKVKKLWSSAGSVCQESVELEGGPSPSRSLGLSGRGSGTGRFSWVGCTHLSDLHPPHPLFPLLVLLRGWLGWG